jgi:hypothetical protein
MNFDFRQTSRSKLSFHPEAIESYNVGTNRIRLVLPKQRNKAMKEVEKFSGKAKTQGRILKSFPKINRCFRLATNDTGERSMQSTQHLAA